MHRSPILNQMHVIPAHVVYYPVMKVGTKYELEFISAKTSSSSKDTIFAQASHMPAIIACWVSLKPVLCLKFA